MSKSRILYYWLGILVLSLPLAPLALCNPERNSDRQKSLDQYDQSRRKEVYGQKIIDESRSRFPDKWKGTAVPKTKSGSSLTRQPKVQKFHDARDKFDNESVYHDAPESPTGRRSSVRDSVPNSSVSQKVPENTEKPKVSPVSGPQKNKVKPKEGLIHEDIYYY